MYLGLSSAELLLLSQTLHAQEARPGLLPPHSGHPVANGLHKDSVGCELPHHVQAAGAACAKAELWWQS